MTNSNQKHHELQGKILVKSKVSVTTKEDLATYYSPGVADPCHAIVADPEAVYTYTGRGNTVAIVSDGSAVLGLGNIGSLAALPVMEGKSMLFSEFANVYAYPLVINSTSDQDVIDFCKMLEPSVGGILLEDIKAPNCIHIETRLMEELSIPVFHDDQHGTAIVTCAALLNLSRLTSKNLADLKIVISGLGAAGSSIARMISSLGVTNIYGSNIHGVVTKDNLDVNDPVVHKLVTDQVIKLSPSSQLADALIDADVFIGVSAPNLLTGDMVKSMATDPWIFAMANPSPEIMPEDAYQAGAFFVGTGRSDYPNQVNNVLAFPGMFKGVLATRQKIDENLKLLVSNILADYIPRDQLSPNNILPATLDKGVADAIYMGIIKEYNEEN